jgi:hypothetical protein
LVEQRIVVNRANKPGIAAPGALESLTKAITALNDSKDDDARYGAALDLLRSGKTAEAAALPELVARDAKSQAENHGEPRSMHGEV